MISEIQNKFIKLRVNMYGAEMISIKSAIDKLEYLWQGNSNFWNGQAPFLFPIVGNVPDGKYKIRDKEYCIAIPHGFAKNSEFTLLEQTPVGLHYELFSSIYSLSQYPYHFKLNVSYCLINNSIVVKYSVLNIDDQTIYFSIGGHPTFNCPFGINERFEDYYLEFERKEYICRILVAEGFLSGKTELFLKNTKFLSLSKEIFSKGAVILKGLKSNSVMMKNNKKNQQIKVIFTGFPYLGIWTLENELSFLGIEPWYGITSKKSDSVDLRTKEGIIELGVNKSFSCQYAILIGEDLSEER